MLNLKAIKWFEWLFIGMVSMMVIWLCSNYQQLRTLMEENAEQSVRLMAAVETNTVKTQEQDITDEVVTAFVTEVRSEERAQQESRKEVLDEYLEIRNHREDVQEHTAEVLELPDQVILAVVEPDPKPVAKPAVKPTPRPAPPAKPQKVHTADTDRAALEHLAQRMHERYCRAKADVLCPTDGADRTVLRSTSAGAGRPGARGSSIPTG